ncbi:hypothetical protein J2T12_001175 [Paenibacillus anaericanus]|uniref:hypothetical protein n=1 Tax=Paenibacillus anaericanus TaxID=170367 RepID=UPI002780434C|nr:hypothetical protein [Paenibacillus anaericanus]MDQ0087769.1 hypothetical protein [Paenibacillus anaericanus]
MPNVLSKITAALLAVLLLYLVPASQAAEREEDIRVLSAYNTLVQFTDAVRNKGYLSSQMYGDFAREIEAFGFMYDIDMEHRHKKYHPEYQDPADATSFKDDFSVLYDSYFTADLMKVLFPDSTFADGNMGNGDIAERKYKMEIGDYFTVMLVKRSVTTYEVLGSFLHGQVSGKGTDSLTYGGMVLNEDY